MPGFPFFGGGDAISRSDVNRLIESNLAVTAALRTVLSTLQALTLQGGQMSKALDDLTAQVKNNTTVIGSALTLIEGFSKRLADAGTDPAALAALQADLNSSDTALASAVAANTDATTTQPLAAPTGPAPAAG